jgi:hypothetical protein
VSEGRPADEGLPEAELEDPDAMPVTHGDVTIPLDPDIAAAVLLDQDDGEDDPEG